MVVLLLVLLTLLSCFEAAQFRLKALHLVGPTNQAQAGFLFQLLSGQGKTDHITPGGYCGDDNVRFLPTKRQARYPSKPGYMEITGPGMYMIGTQAEEDYVTMWCKGNERMTFELLETSNGILGMVPSDTTAFHTMTEEQTSALIQHAKSTGDNTFFVNLEITNNGISLQGSVLEKLSSLVCPPAIPFSFGGKLYKLTKKVIGKNREVEYYVAQKLEGVVLGIPQTLHSLIGGSNKENSLLQAVGADVFKLLVSGNLCLYDALNTFGVVASENNVAHYSLEVEIINFDEPSNKLSGLAIAGIVVGSIVGAGILGFLILKFLRRSDKC